MTNKLLMVVCAKADLSTPSHAGLTSDKLEPYIQQAITQGWSIKLILNPGSFGPKLSSAYDTTKFANYNLLPLAIKLLRYFMMIVVRKESFELGRLKSFLRESKLSSWMSLLDHYQPSLVIGIGLKTELIQACVFHKVSTIEVQHGLFQPGAADQYWPGISPDIFLAWDEMSSGIARSKGMESIVTGHPIVPQLWNHDKEDETRNLSGRSNRKLVCIALSWDEPLVADPFRAVRIELVELVDDVIRRGFTPVFRLHPVASKTKIRTFLLRLWLRDKWPSSIVHVPRETSLSQTISECLGVISYSSSTSLEFAFAGKPSLVVDWGTRLNFARIFSYQGLPSQLLLPTVEDLFNEFLNPKIEFETRFSGSRIFRELSKRLSH